MSDSDQNAILFRSARICATEDAMAAITAGADVNFMDDSGNTALVLAARFGDPIFIAALLKAGADPNLCSPKTGQTVLHTLSGRDSSYIGLAALLLAAGADLHAQNSDGETPVDLAATGDNNAAIRRLFDDHAQDPETASATIDAWDAALRAAESDDVDAFREAFVRGYSVAVSLPRFVETSGKGELTTPLMVACASGSPNVIRFLSTQGLLHPLIGERSHYVRLACKAGSLETVRLLIDESALYKKGDFYRDKEGNTPLHMAAAGGHAHIVDYLLDARAVLLENKAGQTPLDLAIQHDHQDCVGLLTPFKDCEPNDPVGHLGWADRELLRAAKRGYSYSMKEPLDSEASIDCRDAYGAGVLHAAAAASPDCLVLALERGADVNMVDRAGRTPLHVAAKAGAAACVQVLLDAGANMDAVDKRGRRPVDELGDQDDDGELRSMFDGV